jgi:HSP20 family protein
MNSIKDKTKELIESVEETVERGVEVVKETFDNVARHLPLANFAKHSSDSYSIEIDLAGVKKEDIELKVEDDYLTVNAVRRLRDEVEKGDYYLCESSFGLISRSFVLPKDVDRDRISASLENGRLYITLEREEQRKAKSISIN